MGSGLLQTPAEEVISECCGEFLVPHGITHCQIVESFGNVFAILIKHRFDFYIKFKKDLIYLFLERWEGKEKERERNTDV